MKITFLMSGVVWIPSGSFRVIYEYANLLVKMDHEVTIVYPLLKGEKRSNFSIFNIRKRFTKIYPHWFELDSKIILKKIPKIEKKYFPKSDVIIASNWDVIVQLYREFFASKVKLFQFCHHYEVLTGYDIDKVHAALNLPVKKIAVSSWTKELLKKLNFDKIFLVKNGVDLERFGILSKPKERALSICMAYVDKPIKDIDTGISVLKRIKEKHPKIRINLFGPYREAPIVGFDFNYYSRVNEKILIENIYNGSSIFFCSSKFEGFSLPQIEAMACGCALVVTDCGGNRDFAINGTTALVAPSGDLDLLYQNLLVALNSPSLRENLIEQSIKKVRFFSWKTSAEKLLDIIHEE